MTPPARAGAVALLALCCAVAAPAAALARPAPHARAAAPCAVDGRYVMGTILQIELCGGDRGTTRDAALDDAFRAAARIDGLLTTHVGDSPTSRLNAQAGQGAVALPPEVVEVLAAARSDQALTAGTFDVTVGPLVALWRDAGTSQRLPAPDALSAARARVDGARITLDAGGAAAALRDPGMAVDLGGIGKGYALDRLAGRLRAAGFASALLDFGRSSVWALGTPPGGGAWRLLLDHPSGESIGVLELHDVALSVSGSLAQSTTIAGRSFGHVLDPRTGWPLERDLLAVVVAPGAEQAEALSKALLILGERDGIALLERIGGVEGLLAEAGGERWTTRGFQDAVALAPAPRAAR